MQNRDVAIMDYQVVQSLLTGATISSSQVPYRRSQLAVSTQTTLNANHVDPHPLIWTKTTQRYPSGVVISPEVYLKVTGPKAPILPISIPDRYWSDNLARRVEAKAVQKFLNKLRSSDLNLAEDFAEIKQTEKLLDVTADRLAGIAHKARRKAIRWFPRDPSRVLAKAWLSYKYAWEPLVNAIYETVKFQNEQYSKLTINATAKVFSKGSYNYLDGNGYKYAVRYERSYRCKYSVKIRMNDIWLNALSRYSTMSPLSLAWELLPLSFVVDWLINIGGYLQQLETAVSSGWEFSQGYRTVSYKEVVWAVKPPQKGTNGAGAFIIPHAWYESYVRKGSDRKVLTEFPTPFLPLVDIRASMSHLMSAVSLIRVFLGPFKRTRLRYSKKGGYYYVYED